MMRRLMFASVLVLAACGDKQQVDQSSTGDFSPNVVAGGDVNITQNIQLPPEIMALWRQSLIDKGVPAADRAKELEELKRKYADLEQRLGAYAKTDELAQQARKELDAGNLEQAETLLQQAYDQDLKLSQQRLAQRALDLAEVAELRLDHAKAVTRYREVTQLDPKNLQAWKNVFTIARKTGNSQLALDAARGLQQNIDLNNEAWLSIALTDEGSALETLGDTATAMAKHLAALEIDKKRSAKNPNDTDKQRDLSVSYNKVGDLYKANGDTAAALKSYQDSLAIAQKLVALDPKQAEWQNDLAISYYKLAQAQPDKRKELLGEALKILQKLKDENRLIPSEQWKIDDLKKELKK